MKWTARRSLFSASLLLIVFVLPFSASAGMIITEIMYDLPGADTGREWVEVTNLGAESVDITGYRLTEGGVNHTLTLALGSATLAAGQSAVIADNKDKFLIDWPSYAGALFDSSFSLKNATDTIDFKNAELVLLDTAAYASDGGAAGDGNSLHRVDATLVPGAPTPGVYSATAPEPVPPPQPEPTPPEATSTSQTSPPSPDPIATSTDATSTPANTTESSHTTTQNQPTSATTQPRAQTPQASQTTANTQQQSTASAPSVVKATESSATTHTVQATRAQTVPSQTAKASAKTASPRVAYAATDDEAQMAALAEAFESEPQQTPLWYYVAALLGIVLLGVGGAWYARSPAARTASATAPTPDEFEIED